MPAQQIRFAGARFINSGTITAITGARLVLGSHTWSNTGTIQSDNAYVELSGSFTPGSIGTFLRNGGTVALTGALDLTGQTMTLTSATGDWILDGGSVSGGSLQLNGGSLVIKSNINQRLTNGALLLGDLNLSNAWLTLQSNATFSGNASLKGSILQL